MHLPVAVFYADPFEHVYVFDSESDLLVPQLTSQLVMRPEFYNDLVYDGTDICEICIMFVACIDVHTR